MAFQAGYANLKKLGGQILAISGDDEKTLRDFRKSLRAEFVFISDEDGRLMELYDVKYPIFTMAGRWSFVVGGNRQVVKVVSGSDAMDAKKTIEACGRPKKSKVLEAAGDYGEAKDSVEP